VVCTVCNGFDSMFSGKLLVDELVVKATLFPSLIRNST
jgi:hypothetical protein